MNYINEKVYLEYHSKLRERVHSLYGVANADMYKVFISERNILIVLFVTVKTCLFLVSGACAEQCACKGQDSMFNEEADKIPATVKMLSMIFQ